MKILKNILISLSLIILITSCSSPETNSDNSYITINNQKVTVDVADTPELRHQGLSNRPKLPENHGMLFVFGNYTRTSFIMRDMLFPLDIIWIKDNQVVNCSKNLPAPKEGENPVIVSPAGDMNYVLEVSTGFCDKYNIKHGDEVQYMLK